MIKLPLRTLITTLCFFYLFPLFGAKFSGSILEAVGLSAVLSVILSVCYVVQDEVGKEVKASLSAPGMPQLVGVLGMGTYWFLANILAPGLLLKLTALVLPSLLALPSLFSLLGSGLTLFLIGHFTRVFTRPQEEDCGCKAKKKKKPCCKDKSHTHLDQPSPGQSLQEESDDKEEQPPKDIQ